MGGKELEARVVRRHDERHDANGGAELLAELDRALVPMMAVGDEELGILQAVGSVGRKAPQARAVDLDVRGLVRNGERQGRIGQQEDRLRLDPRLVE